MALSKRNRDIIYRALQEKTNEFTTVCPVCKTDTWSILDGIAYLPVHANMRFLSQPTGEVWAAVGMVCTHCGYMMLFNAVVLGIDGQLGESGS